MFISPEAVVFAVRALIRIGTAARDAYEQSVRDADIVLANLPMPAISDDAALFNFFNVPGRRDRIKSGGDLAGFWDAVGTAPKDAPARQILIGEVYKELQSKPQTVDGAVAVNKWLVLRSGEEQGVALLSQWSKAAQPPNPATRIALAFADVALEYVAANPAVLGIGSNGDKLLGALAGNIRLLLPDIDKEADWKANPGKYYFAERALAIVLHAGLDTVSQHTGLIVSEERYRLLLGNVLQPLVQKFDDPNFRPTLPALRDLLLGPMASAALATLQADPRAFFGREFSTDKAVGAITAAVLDAAASGGLASVPTKEGLLSLYRAALGVAASRPELFIKGGKPDAEAARNMLVAVTGALKQAPLPFNEQNAVDLAVAALDAASTNLPRLIGLNPGKPWDALAGNLLTEVLTGFKTGLAAGGAERALADLFTPDEAFRLITIFMQQAAQTPGMITGKGSESEVQQLVAVFASAVASKGARLLTAADWEAVAVAVAAEAARNPARLLKLDGRSTKDQLLAKVLTILLSHADAVFVDGGRSGDTVLFGGTLREALQIAVRAAAGNAAGAEQHLDDLGRLAAALDQLMKENPDTIGADAWLQLFEKNILSVLKNGFPANPTPADRAKLLEDLQT
jgi:hypothetical protein